MVLLSKWIEVEGWCGGSGIDYDKIIETYSQMEKSQYAKREKSMRYGNSPIGGVINLSTTTFSTLCQEDIRIMIHCK